MTEQAAQLRSLDSLLGEHELSGVDFSMTPMREWGEKFIDCSVMYFVLDGETLAVIEDPDDGYRSSMRELRVVDIEISNTFQPIRVQGVLRDPPDVIDFFDVANNQIVLSVGTDCYDDYYPEFVADFIPENMSINQERRTMTEQEIQQDAEVTEWHVSPQIQLVYEERTYVRPMNEVLGELDITVASDREILDAVNSHFSYELDRPSLDLSQHIVVPPAEKRRRGVRLPDNNLLIMENPVFGA